MRRVYSWIVCIVIYIGSSVPMEAQTLINYQQQMQKEIAERQRVEKQRYEFACMKGTLEAFQEYIRLYPKGKYATDIKNRIKDYNLWSKAVKTNTIEAYNNYIDSSKFKSFKDNAIKSITELQSIDKWKSIQSSKNIAEIELFMKTYPKSSCIAKAQRRIHELKGVDFYLSNDLLSAYQEFDKAGGKYALEQTNQSKFNECQEYWDYNNLTSNSPEEKLLTFLNKYPTGKYSDEISNRIAISKAKSFTFYSYDDTFNEALGYAKDETTRNLVNSYIKNRKRSNSQYYKQRRKARIKANGGYVQFGFELFDFGANITSNDLHLIYYNIGASVKLGNFRSPVQLEIGIKPGVVLYSDDYADETNTEFQLPAYAKLKINICNAGRNSKFYIAGLGYYNIVNKLENQFSVGVGTGFAWKHWDWLTLYYKEDLDNKYLGTSLIYYF